MNHRAMVFACNMLLLFAGNARVKDCLEEHRDETEFSPECKEEFETMMESRAADYRLDSSLREKCADDIEDLCGFQKVAYTSDVSSFNFLSSCLSQQSSQLLDEGTTARRLAW